MKWNSPEGRQAFDDWLLGDETDELFDPAEPAQISELTVAAGGFLRRQNSILHAFSDEAVHSVRGLTKLDALTLAHDPSEDTYTFVRTYGPEDLRKTIRDVGFSGPCMSDLEAEALTDIDDLIISSATEEYIGELRDDFPVQEPDMQAKRSALCKDTFLDSDSDITSVWPDRLPITTQSWSGSFQIYDYLQLRHALSAESRQRRL
jgi:hypothetical protein